jgi:TonB family protein
VTLYRAATGAAPFTAAQLERLAAGDEVPLVPPLERVPELDPGVAAALVHALHPDPAARPADADALLAAMDGVAPPPTARPVFVPTAVSGPAEPPAAPAPAPAIAPEPEPPVRRGTGVKVAGGALALAAGAAAVYALNSGDDPAPVLAPVDTTAVAQVDTTPPDSTSLDTAATPVVITQPEPEPQPVDSTPVAAPAPTPPPGERVYDVGSVDEPPELRNRRDVIRILERNYPPVLRDARVSGDVILSFVVDREGRVEPNSIQAVNSADPQFVDAARRVAERMRFRPGRVRDEPVRTSVQVPVSFRPD